MEIFNILKGAAESPTAAEDGESALLKGSILRALVLDSQPSGQATLRLGPHIISALISRYLEPGLEVKLQVVETSPRLILRLVTEQGPESKSPENQPVQLKTPSPSALNPPTILARITAVPADDRIKVRILNVPPQPPAPHETKEQASRPLLAEGRELTARVIKSDPGLSFRPGQELKFTVRESSPQLVLQIAEPAPTPRPPLFQALAPLLSNPGQLAQAVAEILANLPLESDFPSQVQTRAATLAGLLTELSPKMDPPDKEFLGRLSGLLGLGSQRASIQEEVARLWSEMVRNPDLERFKDTPALRALIEATAKFYEAVEQLQTLNHETSRGDEAITHFSFPLFWPGENGRGEIQFRRQPPGEQTDDDQAFNVAILLTLSKLGRLKIDVQVKKNVLQGAIWTETPKVQAALREKLGRLSQSLEARGFKVTQFSVYTLPPTQRTPDSLVEELLPRQEGLINIKV